MNTTDISLKSDIKSEILDLLKKSHMGLSIRNISKELNRSRTTITKYLKQLSKERLVIDQKIGQYRVWISKDTKLDVNDSLVYSINNSILKNLTKLNMNKKDIKELGKFVAKDFNFSNYLDNSHLVIASKMPKPKEVADGLMKIIDSICLVFDNYSWHPPIIKEDFSVIIIRMYDSNLISNPNYFHLISGFIEQEMNKYVKSKVNVIQVKEKEKIVDFQFEIFV